MENDVKYKKGVNIMKNQAVKEKIKLICNKKQFIWGVRVCGWILGPIEAHLILFHSDFFWKNPVLSFLLFGSFLMTEYKVKYKEMSDMKRIVVAFGFLAVCSLIVGVVYIIGCPEVK